MTAPKTERARRSLLESLIREFFQTETSALKHCRREARRLGDESPARALLAVSNQAARVLRELPEICEQHKLPRSAGGVIVGSLFSFARDKFADRLIRLERSYRGTMLGVRHGVDLVLLLAKTARDSGLSDLEEFCEQWLAARQPLVEDLERELAWFAQHPPAALRFAR
jgi:hypothetical protein